MRRGFIIPLRNSERTSGHKGFARRGVLAFQIEKQEQNNHPVHFKNELFTYLASHEEERPVISQFKKAGKHG